MHAIRGRGYLKMLFGAALLAAVLVVTVAPIAQSQSSVKCFGRTATDVGTSGPDNIVGDPQTVGDNDNPRDVIAGLGGADNIRGEGDFAGTPEGGQDFICGGRGNDPFMDGADKTDFIQGDLGDDLLDGDNFPSPFRDFLYGEEGDDTHTGGQGNDVIRAGQGSDDIDVGTGTVNAGADNVKGGGGNDTINEAGDNARDTIDCGPGNDTVTADPTDNVARNCETVNGA